MTPLHPSKAISGEQGMILAPREPILQRLLMMVHHLWVVILGELVMIPAHKAQDLKKSPTTVPPPQAASWSDSQTAEATPAVS